MSWLRRFLDGLREEPAPAPEGEPERVREVQEALSELRPLLAADGGDVRLVSVRGGAVELRLRGACRSCHASATTLGAAIEPHLRSRLAWIESVRAIS